MPTSPRPAPKGARKPGARPLARRFSTKIHLKTDFAGLPIAFDLTAGQASDSLHFPDPARPRAGHRPVQPSATKGYDSKANREVARSRGICPVFPFKTTAKNPPAFFPRALYRGRARIEQAVDKLKRFKRVALRLREDGPKLRLLRRIRSHLHPRQIRPQHLDALVYYQMKRVPEFIDQFAAEFELGLQRRIMEVEEGYRPAVLRPETPSSVSPGPEEPLPLTGPGFSTKIVER